MINPTGHGADVSQGVPGDPAQVEELVKDRKGCHHDENRKGPDKHSQQRKQGPSHFVPYRNNGLGAGRSRQDAAQGYQLDKFRFVQVFSLNDHLVKEDTHVCLGPAVGAKGTDQDILEKTCKGNVIFLSSESGFLLISPIMPHPRIRSALFLTGGNEKRTIPLRRRCRRVRCMP